MKVTKPGRPQKGWSIEATCTGDGNKGGGCGAHLLVEQADIYKTASSAMGEVEFYNTFCCPCGVETDLPNRISLPFTPPDKRLWTPPPAAPAHKQPQPEQQNVFSDEERQTLRRAALSGDTTALDRLLGEAK